MILQVQNQQNSDKISITYSDWAPQILMCLLMQDGLVWGKVPQIMMYHKCWNNGFKQV